MRIQIGSKVKFLNDVGSGVVIGFKDDRFVIVETEDGFEMPVLISELIEDKTVSYDKQASNSGIIEVQIQTEKLKKKKSVVTFEEKKYLKHKGEVILALVPDNEQLLHVSNFGLYIINDSNYRFRFVTSYFNGAAYNMVKAGSIGPDSKIEISSYSQTEIAKIKAFRIQGIFFKYGHFDPAPAIDMEFNIEEVSFYKTGFFKENDYFNEKSLILQKEKIDMQLAIEKLSKSEIAKVIRVKEEKDEDSKPKPKAPKKSDIEEVDLHIGEIVDKHEHLSNGEIVELQLARFETALETALRSDTRKLVFIHGVGAGKLKHELRNKLTRKYPDLKFQDASFKEYGYGATLVYIK